MKKSKENVWFFTSFDNIKKCQQLISIIYCPCDMLLFLFYHFVIFYFFYCKLSGYLCQFWMPSRNKVGGFYSVLPTSSNRQVSPNTQQLLLKLLLHFYEKFNVGGWGAKLLFWMKKSRSWPNIRLLFEQVSPFLPSRLQVNLVLIFHSNIIIIITLTSISWIVSFVAGT